MIVLFKCDWTVFRVKVLNAYKQPTMRELAQLVVSEFHLRALFIGFGMILGFNCGLQYKPSVTPFIATVGSSGSTLLLPAAPLDEMTPVKADFLFPSRSITASFRTTPTSTTILPPPTTSALRWFIPSQTNWDSYAELTNGIFESSSDSVSKSSFSELTCNSTLSDHAIEPCFEALTRVLVATRSLQKTPRPIEAEEGFTDLILYPSYASQEQAASCPGWIVQVHEFGLVEILVLPAVLAIAIRFTVYVTFIVLSTVASLLVSSVTLCAYSTRICRASLAFLDCLLATALGFIRRQGKLRARHRKNNTTLSSLRAAAVQSFLYAPEQRMRLEHIILHDENTSTPIPSSKDLYDPRYLVIVKTLDNIGSGRVSIVKNFKKQDEADADEGQLMLKTVGRYVGGYQLLQFAQELRALDRLRKNRWCHKLVASFAGPEDLHMLMTYYPRGDIADFVREAGGHLGRAQAKYYLVELFIAIRVIHKMGVFHRRISLENLFLTGSGHLVLSDFGNAKINYHTNGLTEDESAQTAISPDGFRDYYAAIKVYYEMVTGNPLSTIHSKRPAHDITKEDNSLFKLLLRPFSENRKLPSPMDVQRHAIFDRINWDAMEKQLVAIPPPSAN